jgi:cytosine/adenosine deaminase-related metal-dependent hydrolase
VIAGECTDELWIGCNELALGYGAPIHTHLAETKIQAVGSLQQYGQSLVRRMESLGVLGPKLTCGHSIWIDDNDIARLAGAGTNVAHNPASNLKLGSGIAPIREMLDRGVPVGLGTDGSMSSDNQNMFEAMRFAALVSKIRFGHDPDRWVSADEVFKMATIGSATLMGLQDAIGTIEAGKKADLVLLRRESVFLRPLNDLTNAIVYCETGADIECVYVGGRLVVKNNVILTVDEEDIYARAQAAVDRLMNENTKAIELSRRIQPYLRHACKVCASMKFPINRYACEPVAQ